MKKTKAYIIAVVCILTMVLYPLSYVTVTANEEEEYIELEDVNENDFFALEGAYFTITSKRTGKVIESPGSNFSNGGVIQQWDRDKQADNQLWFIEEAENNYFKIKNKVTEKVIDIKDAVSDNGTLVHQWEYEELDNQLWYFEECEDGYYKIKSKLNNKCLDIVGISENNGAQVQIWDDVDGDNQKWKVEQEGIQSITTITSKRNEKVIEVPEGKINNGEILQQQEKSDSAEHQIWKFESIDDKYYKIINQKSGKAIDMKDAGSSNGNVVHQWDYKGLDNQLWYLEICEDGYYKIKSKLNHKCLDIVGISNENGAQIQIWDDVNGDNQKWKIAVNTNKDSDNDLLPDYTEVLLGSNPLKEDTDGDGLDDYYEYYMLKTDPTVKDTDDNGLDDNLEDMDEDGLNNEKEYKAGTSPIKEDSDQDGLSDGEEVNKYQTDPLKEDTDGDGLSDGDEILLGLDPLKKDTDGDGVIDSKEEKEQTVTADFTKIEDEEEDWYYLMDDTSIIDTKNHTVSYTTTHFSTYLLVDRQKWYDTWSKNIEYRNTDEDGAYYDIAFVVDTSGSMEEDGRLEKSKTALNTYVDGMYHKDRAGLIKFTYDADEICSIQSSRDELKSGIESLTALGGTDTNRGLLKGIEMLSEAKGENEKIILLICDGDINYVQETVQQAVDKDIKIYAVNVGYHASSEELKKMADQTNGSYYYATTSDDILEALSKIQEETIEDIDTKDTDGDGLYDVYEEKGIRVSNGEIIYTDPLKADTDEDGISDYEELGGVITRTIGNEKSTNLSLPISERKSIRTTVAKKQKSSPRLKDTDGDGIADKKDPKPKEHFGKIAYNGKIRRLFKVVKNNTYMPINKDIKDKRANNSKNEWDVYKNRFSKKYKSAEMQGIQAYLIKQRAGATAAGGLVLGSLPLPYASRFLGMYYDNKLTCSSAIKYSAYTIVNQTMDGKDYFEKNMKCLMRACENGVGKGEKLIISSTINACLSGFDTAASVLNSAEMDTWLSIGSANAAIVCDCSYDGKEYKMNVNYYIEDFYDFYEPDKADGNKKEVGLCTNDDWVILSYYDNAEPFTTIGIYKVKKIVWEKGQKFEDINW